MIINSTFFDVVAAKQHEPFVWGTNDCALFVADIYEVLYGVDFAEGIRGTYSDEYHGMRKIVELGGWNEILTSRNFEKIENKNFLKRGDVVVARNALGIWVGTYAILAGGAHLGLTEVTEVYRYKE